MVKVKICGLTTVDDATAAVDAGADALGLNFYSKSARCVATQTAIDIVEAVGDRSLVVGVFVDATVDEIRSRVDEVGLHCVQLHGDEPPSMLESLLPHAYKALRVQGQQSLQQVDLFGGDHVLLDAYVKGMPGGTGATFDWSLAAQVARRRRVTLAGGLVPGNVGDAVRAVRPYCVDVASGVESSPGRKDPAMVELFIRNARAALLPTGD